MKNYVKLLKNRFLKRAASEAINPASVASVDNNVANNNAVAATTDNELMKRYGPYEPLIYNQNHGPTQDESYRIIDPSDTYTKEDELNKLWDARRTAYGNSAGVISAGMLSRYGASAPKSIFKWLKGRNNTTLKDLGTSLYENSGWRPKSWSRKDILSYLCSKLLQASSGVVGAVTGWKLGNLGVDLVMQNPTDQRKKDYYNSVFYPSSGLQDDDKAAIRKRIIDQYSSYVNKQYGDPDGQFNGKITPAHFKLLTNILGGATGSFAADTLLRKFGLRGGKEDNWFTNLVAEALLTAGGVTAADSIYSRVKHSPSNPLPTHYYHKGGTIGSRVANGTARIANNFILNYIPGRRESTPIYKPLPETIKINKKKVKNSIPNQLAMDIYKANKDHLARIAPPKHGGKNKQN